jgi:hypothetical protein
MWFLAIMGLGFMLLLGCIGSALLYTGVGGGIPGL